MVCVMEFKRSSESKNNFLTNIPKIIPLIACFDSQLKEDRAGGKS